MYLFKFSVGISTNTKRNRIKKSCKYLQCIITIRQGKCKTAARFSLAAVPLPHSGDFFVVVGDFGVFVVPETLVAHAVKILLGVAEFEPV